MDLVELIKLVKRQIYYIVINIIVFVYMMTPYISVKVINKNGVQDLSYIFAFKYLLNRFLYYDLTKKKYQVHLKTLDKLFILHTSESELIHKHKAICEASEILNPPRSLFTKYDIFVNGTELSIDQKAIFKKYAEGTNICDMFEFNGIKLLDLKVLKNNKHFKAWDDKLEELTIEAIYPYL